MKRRFLVFLLLALLPASVGCATSSNPTFGAIPPRLQPRVRVKCHSDLGMCEVTALPDVRQSRRGRPTMVCSVVSGQRELAGQLMVTFGFQVQRKDARYNICPTMRLWADGHELSERPAESHMALGKHGLVEAISASLSLAELGRLARAHKVRWQVCNTVVPLSADDHALLRHVVGRTTTPRKEGP